MFFFPRFGSALVWLTPWRVSYSFQFLTPKAAHIVIYSIESFSRTETWSSVLWSPGPLVLWFSGPLVPWSSVTGPLVLWSPRLVPGALALFSPSLLVSRSSGGLLHSGLLVLWPLVLWVLCFCGAPVRWLWSPVVLWSSVPWSLAPPRPSCLFL